MRWKNKVLLVVLGAVLLASPLLQWVVMPSQLTLPAAHLDEHGKLPDGVYAVLWEADTADAIDNRSEAYCVLQQDGRFSGEQDHGRATFVAVDVRAFVPFVFRTQPKLVALGDGCSSLYLALASRYADALEAFTTKNDRVAIVIDGSVITRHKVREPIRDGRVRISRCNDDACRVLHAKLTD